MRDNRKDKEYYRAYLDYQYSRIEKKLEKLKESDGEKRQRVLVSLTGYVIDLLKAEFSYGASKEDLKTLLIRAISMVDENTNVTFDDLLTILSFAVILEAGNDAKKLIESKANTISEDRLLHFLSTYIENGKGEWDQNISLRKEYELLNRIFDSDDKEAAFNEYLAEWYGAHSGYAWYNSHLRDTDTYCGYWSFESAAVATIMGLDSAKMNSEYYPVL